MARPRNLQELPQEILVKIAKSLSSQPEDRHDSDAHGGVDSAWRIYDQEHGPNRDMWSFCQVSKLINGPATEALYSSVDLHKYAHSRFLRTIYEQPERIKRVHHLRLSCFCPDHLDFRGRPSHYSTVTEDVALLLDTVNSRGIALQPVITDVYGSEWADPVAQLLVIIILLKELKGIEVGFQTFPLGAPHVHTNFPMPRALWELITKKIISKPYRSGNVTVELALPQLGLLDKVTYLALSRVSEHSDASRGGLRTKALGIENLPFVLRLPALRRLELLGFGPSVANVSTVTSLQDTPPIPNMLEHLAMVHCRFSSQELGFLLEQTSKLKSFVWKSPSIENICLFAAMPDICFKSLDVIGLLAPCSDTLESLAFAGIEMTEQWVAGYNAYKARPPRFMAPNLPGPAELQRDLCSPVSPSIMQQFANLRHVDVSLPSLIGLQYRHLPNHQREPPLLSSLLPPSVQTIRLVVPSTMFGLYQDKEKWFERTMADNALFMFRIWCNEIVGSRSRLPALKSLKVSLSSASHWQYLTDFSAHLMDFTGFKTRRGTRLAFVIPRHHGSNLTRPLVEFARG